jgi:hypothetical protein
MTDIGTNKTDSYNLTRDENLLWPSSVTDQPLAIRRSLLEGLNRSINRCDSPSNWIGYLSSFFLAVFATAGLSIIPLYYAQGLNLWVVPLYVVITIASVILGITFFLLDQRDKHRSNQDIKVVKDEMKILISQYQTTDANQTSKITNAPTKLDDSPTTPTITTI